MLETLSIRNLAVVEAVDVHFYPGFHVLTGRPGQVNPLLLMRLD